MKINLKKNLSMFLLTNFIFITSSFEGRAAGYEFSCQPLRPRQEAARLEAERQEAVRREAERQEAARLEAERQEAARREAERQETIRQEAMLAMKKEAIDDIINCIYEIALSTNPSTTKALISNDIGQLAKAVILDNGQTLVRGEVLQKRALSSIEIATTTHTGIFEVSQNRLQPTIKEEIVDRIVKIASSVNIEATERLLTDDIGKLSRAVILDPDQVFFVNMAVHRRALLSLEVAGAVKIDDEGRHQRVAGGGTAMIRALRRDRRAR